MICMPATRCSNVARFFAPLRLICTRVRTLTFGSACARGWEKVAAEMTTVDKAPGGSAAIAGGTIAARSTQDARTQDALERCRAGRTDLKLPERGWDRCRDSVLVRDA
jgi:hypothetical protein